jgi:hypothetical protein
MLNSFHPEAHAEFRLAIDYYEEREKALGHQFAVEVYGAIERTAAHTKCGHSYKKVCVGVLFRKDALNIFIDESESFVNAPKQESWNSVAAYMSPESDRKRLRELAVPQKAVHERVGAVAKGNISDCS